MSKELRSRQGQLPLVDRFNRPQPASRNPSGNKVRLYYFTERDSADGRAFTPRLARATTALRERKIPVEVVVVSFDDTFEEWAQHMKEMPRWWLAVPWSDKATRQSLFLKYEVEALPTLVVVGGDGDVIQQDACTSVVSDPLAREFPWHSQRLSRSLSDSEDMQPPSCCLACFEIPRLASRVKAW
eukprot:CAMPEP_0202908246 /NCGR_PEP_ID=MMETSP1392-20130828/45380_1 /ASSEMBLY_ACC=CAM_ASM_000868 /TAXON_ID=225041 /ORGANISM="Chlamydomonas chlamydogama, Strain SAG 11-48b" /LENGTH=184 /DNA_ID=CAMNT_0049597487 /DNA_START=137 /DNA_END=688 /DNA_ORIENTATION=+